MDPVPASDNDLLRKRVALGLMCFRFGKDPRNPPKPQDTIPIDLSTDLARSVERQILNSAALLFLQNRPFLPFTWKLLPSPDFLNLKERNFANYHALCWLHLQPRLTMQAEVESAIRGAGLVADQPANTQVEASETASMDDIFALLVDAVDSVEGEDFSQNITVAIPLEG